MKANTETTVWSGRSSQMINTRVFVYSILMTFLIILSVVVSKKNWIAFFLVYPFGRVLFAWYEVYSAKYTLTSERLIFSSGVFNRITSEIELNDIKDVILLEPWYLRPFKLGNIELVSKQNARLNFTLKVIANASDLREQIRELIQKLNTQNSRIEQNEDLLTRSQTNN